MAGGDYVVRRNASNTDTIPNAGTDLLLLWDTAVANVGSGITYSAGTFTLGETGHFLVMCSDQAGSTSTTNPARLNWKNTFTLAGTELVEGYSTGFIRKFGGAQEALVFSAAIINVATTTGNGDELEVRSERIDSVTTGGEEPNRVSDRSSITILKLNDAWNYGRYQSSSVFATSTTDHVDTTATLGTTDEEDSPFTRSTNTIDIATNNLVLAVYSLKSEDAAPTGRAEYQGFLEMAAAQQPGSWTQTYIRVDDNNDWGGMSCVCLLEPTSGDDLTLEVKSRESGGEDFSAALQLVELPTGTEAIIVEATTGSFNDTAASFVWDTNPYIDTAAFTHTTGTAAIDVDNAGDYIVAQSFGYTSDTPVVTVTRAVPAVGVRVEGVDSETGGGSSCYNRNSVTAGHPAIACAGFLPGLSAADTVNSRLNRLGTASGTITAESAAMSLIRYDSLDFGGGGGGLGIPIAAYHHTHHNQD